MVMKSVSQTSSWVLIPAVVGTLFTVLFATCPAQATTIYSGSSFQVEVTSPVPVGTTALNLVAFELKAIGLAGVKPNSFDSANEGSGGSGITTTGSLLHQVWEFGSVQTPTETLNVADSIPMDLDTHFLLEDSDLLTLSDPDEEVPDGAGLVLYPAPLEHEHAGFRHELTGTFVLKPGLEDTEWNFAQIVVPVGTEVFFDFSVAADGVAAERINTSFTAVPEPGTLLLGVAGAVMMLFSTRRREAR